MERESKKFINEIGFSSNSEFNILNYIPVIRTILKRNLDNLNRVFTVSEFSRKKLIDITSTEVINIGAGADVEDFKRDYEVKGGLTVGVVSRFVSRKKINFNIFNNILIFQIFKVKV